MLTFSPTAIDHPPTPLPLVSCLRGAIHNPFPSGQKKKEESGSVPTAVLVVWCWPRCSCPRMGCSRWCGVALSGVGADGLCDCCCSGWASPCFVFPAVILLRFRVGRASPFRRRRKTSHHTTPHGTARHGTAAHYTTLTCTTPLHQLSYP